MKVLLLNHKKKQCGVYQYGLRIFNILAKDTKIVYIYNEVESYDEYINILSNYDDLDFIIYNLHLETMKWLNSSNIQKRAKNIGIPHETCFNMFDYTINIEDNFPRPIFENIDETLINYKFNSKNIEEFVMYKEDNIPIFGSFGFGFSNKGFPEIVRLVNSVFDRAIIKFVITTADFSAYSKEEMTENIRKLCFSENTKSGIKLMITHDFFSNEDLLEFLRRNNANIFLYSDKSGRGLSSVIDYAISVKRPLLISDSCMFRHIYSDKICIFKTNFQECINNSMEHCKKYTELWSHENLMKRVREILENLR